jgi:hypothetical protein
VSLIPGESPLIHAPSRGDPRLVPWLTRADLPFLARFEFGPSISLIGTGLADAVLRPTLARRVRDTLGRGLALHPQLYLLQLTAEHQRLYFADEIALLGEPLEETIDPLAELLDDDAVERLAAHVLDLGVNGLGTALLAGAFLLREPGSVGLDNNLALLAASARYFDEEGLADAADETVRFQRPRQLFATISLERRVLRDEAFMRELLDAYVAAAPGLYGYWVQVANLGSAPRADDVRRLSDFLYELERRTDKPAVADRLGQLGLGYLAGGLSGYCIGTGAPEFLRHPPTIPVGSDGQKPKGFALVAYHAAYLRNFQTRGPHADRAAAAFARLRCGCGHHEPGKPPAGNVAKKLHCFHWRVEQAANVLAGSAAENVRAFLQLVQRGEEASRALDGDLRLYAALRETLPPEAAEATATG